MTKEYQNYPFWDVARYLERQLNADPRFSFHQKFTCGQCGARQAMEERNKFHKKGICEICGHTTNLVVSGCNYIAIYQRKVQ